MVTQHARLALLIGAAALCPAGALAQPASGLDRVLACADIEREIARLECYDEAAAAVRGEAESRSETPAAARAPQRTDAADAGQREADDEDRASASPPVAAERNVEGPAVSGRGDDDDRDRQVTIVEVRTSVPGRAVFVTSDGDEYVQTSGRLRLYLPDVPFQASLRTGAVGGTFLTPEGTRRSIRISERD